MDDLNKSKRFLSVNWEDGMLVNAAHLIDQERYFESLNHWTIKHGIQFFGLTSASSNEDSSLEIRVDFNGRDWVVVLSRCMGLTASGRILQIDEQFENNLVSSPIQMAGDDRIPVYVWAKNTKTGIGLPSGDDEPTRQPYRGFEYSLITGNLLNIDPADCLKVGEIYFEDEKPDLHADFIPPCTVIGAHPLLAEQCRRLSGLILLAQQEAAKGYQAFISVMQDKPGKFGIDHKQFQDMLANISVTLGGKMKVHPDPDLPILPYNLILFYQQIFGAVDAMISTYRDAAITLKKKYEGDKILNRFLDGSREFINAGYNHHALGQLTSKLVLLMTDFVEFIGLIRKLSGELTEIGKIMTYRNREYNLQTFRKVDSNIERDGVTIKIDGFDSMVSRDVLISLKRELLGGVDYRYIMVKIGINDNNIPGRMDPVYIDAETSPGNLLLKPMDDLADPSITTINLNVRGNFNPQDLKDIKTEMVNVYVY